jgi:hypothetical protein
MNSRRSTESRPDHDDDGLLIDGVSVPPRHTRSKRSSLGSLGWAVLVSLGVAIAGLLAAVAIVIYLLLPFSTYWASTPPGSNGRRSCGSVLRPAPGALHDEACFDVRRDRQHSALSAAIPVGVVLIAATASSITLETGRRSSRAAARNDTALDPARRA